MNGKEVDFKEGESILEVARRNSFRIPTLCEMTEMDHTPATCRVCLVQIQRQGEERPFLVTSCNTPMEAGLEIQTRNQWVRESQRLQVELLLADHDMNCMTCIRHGDCELQDVAKFVGLEENRFNDPELFCEREVDTSSPSIVRDMKKCIRCLRCVKICREVQGTDALVISQGGTAAQISPKNALELSESTCVSCGQCTQVCPVGALSMKNDIERVVDFLNDPDITTVFEYAPAIRVALGEEFGLPPGSIVTGHMNAGLKALGADAYLDTNFTADLVIMEEGTELLHRVQNNGVLPLFTSCSPGWVNFIEKNYPEFLPHVSTAKSPQQCFGALAKTYLADHMKVKPENMRVISIMPCTAKKEEATRPEFIRNGQPDVDVVLTTREFADLLKREEIYINELEPCGVSHELMGDHTGAGVIFGTTGGVTEAAVRTLHYILNGKELEGIDVKEVRGKSNIKAADVELSPELGKVKIAVVHGLKAARQILEDMKEGSCPYTFIEFMACPGGCINGGGQPRTKKKYQKNWDKRIEAIYEDDRQSALRQSHNNPQIQKIYKDFLGEPLSHKSHELLHTTYRNRKKEYRQSIEKIWADINGDD